MNLRRNPRFLEINSHSPKFRFNVGEVALGSTDFFQIISRDKTEDLRFLTEGLEQRNLLSPSSHCGPLDGFIGVLSGHAAVGEFEQDRLAPV